MTNPVINPVPERIVLQEPRIFEKVLPVKDNAPVNGEYRMLVLDAPIEILRCTPGQFFHIQCPIRGDYRPYLRRPMSIYDYSPEQRELRFLYKVTGTGTAALAELLPGEQVNIVGPLGQGFQIREDWNTLLLLARGVGLATLMPLASQAQRLDKKLIAVCSARSPELLMSVARFRAFGADVITATDTEGTSDPSHIRALIENLISDQGVDAFYTCGSKRLLKLLQDIALSHGIPGQVALEQQMACGIGMCQCCVRPFRAEHGIVHRRVCKEGPVFGLHEAMA